MGKDEDSEKEEVTPKIISKIPLTSTLLRLWFIVSNARFLTRVRLQTMIPLIALLTPVPASIIALMSLHCMGLFIFLTPPLAH